MKSIITITGSAVVRDNNRITYANIELNILGYSLKIRLQKIEEYVLPTIDETERKNKVSEILTDDIRAKAQQLRERRRLAELS